MRGSKLCLTLTASKTPCRSRGGDHAVGFLQGHRHRLFDENMLAALERRHGMAEMQPVGRGDIDEIDGRIIA